MMKRSSLGLGVSLAMFVVATRTLAGCSDDTAATPSNADGGGPSTNDGSTGDSGGDGGACVQAAGLWKIERTCPAQFAAIDFACVAQKDCAMKISTRTTSGAAGAVLDGTTNATGFEAGACKGSQQSATTTSLDCTQGGATCSGTMTKVNVPNLILSPCCDVNAQADCGSGAKCTVVFGGTGNAPITACITSSGTAADGAGCTRPDTMAEGIGRDDCAPGLVCSALGAPSADQRFCRRLCTASAACGANAACANVINSVPRAGHCVTLCHAFGTDCAGGVSCKIGNTIEGNDMFCFRTGAGATGASCATHEDCDADNVCVLASGTGTCRKMCDDTHACASNETCSDKVATSTSGMVGHCK